jgi:hypothetical protein
MEPPKPAKRDEVLRNALNAAPEDYEEYERLLALHFTKDPSAARGRAAAAAAPDPDEERLRELTQKLFGAS